MEKFDVTNDEILPTTIDFFNTKPNLVAFQNSGLVEYPPIYPIGNGGPIRFRINSGQTYLDLSKTYLHTKFKVTKKEDGKFVPITNKDTVSFIQGFGATFIRNLKVSFNNRHVYHSNDLYAYDAYFRRRLGLGVSRKEGTLQSAGFFEDDLSQTSGTGFEARRSLFENDQIFETICSIDADIFRQPKLLVSQTIVDIEIDLHKQPFVLLTTGTEEYHYHLLDCNLYTKQHLLFPHIDYAIQQKIENDNLVKYDYTQTVLKSFYINPGRYEFRTPLFNGYVPKRVFAALVDAKAFHGHVGMSPFEFAPHGIETIHIRAVESFVPAFKYELGGKNLTRAFKDLNDATDEIHGISYLKFKKHSCIFAFDIQSQHSEDFIETRQKGSTVITLQFKEAIPQNGLQLIIFAEFNSIMTMDRGIINTLPIQI
uniref:Uncharacterized protein n=1 Tax=Panagrolaimus davidi TaxID=227884 RepID=A0A914QCV3_9BILA